MKTILLLTMACMCCAGCDRPKANLEEQLSEAKAAESLAKKQLETLEKSVREERQQRVRSQVNGTASKADLLVKVLTRQEELRAKLETLKGRSVDPLSADGIAHSQKLAWIVDESQFLGELLKVMKQQKQ